MICPKCRQRVDPITDEMWTCIFDSVDWDNTKLSNIDILRAIYTWDMGAMKVSGMSVLPTELRDALRQELRKYIPTLV